MKNKELNTLRCLVLIKNSLIKFKINLKLQSLPIQINRQIKFLNLINQNFSNLNLINLNFSNLTMSNQNFTLKKVNMIKIKKVMYQIQIKYNPNIII